MHKKFKIGEVVNLKSGGRSMTIIAEKDDRGFVQVTWLDAHGTRNKFEDGYFVADALVKHQPDDQSET